MSHPTRREFLTALAATPLATRSPALAAPHVAPRATASRCVFINLVGGPPHLDTFDPKPEAPVEVRGPFQTIRTRVPGTHLSELFPRLAAIADTFTLVRSLHHTAPPVHEAGFQLLNTGRLFRDGPDWPGLGAVVCRYLGVPDGWQLLPDGEVETGIPVGRGMGPGWLADVRPRTAPQLAGADFVTLCRAALRRVRAGCRFVTINAFPTVFDAPSWDCHAAGGSLRTCLADLRDTVAPACDSGLAELLTGLRDEGLLDETLVVAVGEFGRTPRLNANGGRDHWAGAWTALMAGGGVRSGAVIGRTDAHGSEPVERPVTPPELVATVLSAFGIPYDATLPGPDGRPVPIYPARPVAELF